MALPTVITAAGLQPTSPETLYNQVIALVQAKQPGYTSNIPGIMISDIGQTDAYSLAQCDQARVELINSISPYTSNPFILNQQGTLVGIPPNVPTNTSVYCIFTGTVGYPVERGFLVTDGTYQYSVYAATVIPSSGATNPILCIATVSGSWAVPQDSVNELATSIPVSISLSVNNPTAGTPSQGVESEEQFRSRVIQGYEATSVGVPNFLYTLLTEIPGVNPTWTTVATIDGGGWEIIVGGNGNPYAIAFAIFQGIADISSIVGSTMTISGITVANPGIVTTVLNHGYVAGNVVAIAGSANANYNGTYTVTAPVTNKTFSLGVNTTGFGAYTGGGVLTPNARNQVVSINQPPNVYQIPFIVPPAQTVLIAMLWNTTATNIISNDAVALLGAPAIANYVSAIKVGQPINTLELRTVFQLAVSSIIPIDLLTRMAVTVTINGVVVAPISGTGICAGDPESYFVCGVQNVTVAQG
jgi:hypothetical protein